MVCRLPPNHGNSKVQTPLVIGTPAQSLGACLANHVWHPSFILVSKFNTKINIVSMLYETCDWLPIRNNSVFSTYVAKYVRLISARSSGRSHLIHLQNKNRYKLVINWCHRSPPRSVFGATSTTKQIFRDTHEPKSPVHARVEFSIHFLGHLPINFSFYPPTLCFVAPIFGKFRGFMTSNWSLFDIITQNYRTWILLVIKILISNQNNYSTFYPHQLLLKFSTHSYILTKP